eukprot:TRINITY_DN26278_c0_g1_i1.p1 TRINITY_DN26278_c0_g1~~TRINITY_DN26278_c0_g1_i1.p1  ORF type:complete len:316 (+),score=101.21 TRINITY_DN26278_c0_g1_i1:67-948(+)
MAAPAAAADEVPPDWVDSAVCYALWKPRNLLTTNKVNPGVVGVQHRRPCMGQWLQEVAAAHPVPRLFHVGRLDRKTSGLILATASGQLSQWVCCPGRLAKEYEVTTQHRPAPDAVARMLAGVQLADGPARALEAEVLSVEEDLVTFKARGPKKRRLGAGGAAAESGAAPAAAGEPEVPVAGDAAAAPPAAAGGGAAAPPPADGETVTRMRLTARIRVVVDIGRNHIVKKLCHAVGLHVTGLHRTRIGPLSLADAGLTAEGQQQLLNRDQLLQLWRGGLGRGDDSAAGGEDIED